MNTFYLYIIIVLNLLGFLIMGYDKILARLNKWRISEKGLFSIAFFGGAVGVYLGMRLFHHKTQHKSFVFGIPILVILNIFSLFILYKYFGVPVIID